MKMGLLYKMLVLGIALTFTSVAVFSVAFIYNQINSSRSSIEQGGLIFGKFVTNAIYQDYVQFYTHPTDLDFENFKIRVNAKLSYNADIKSVTLVSTTGRILFDTSEFADGKYNGGNREIKDTRILEQLTNKEPSIFKIDGSGNEAPKVYVYAPVEELSGTHVLAVLYELTYDSLTQKLKDALKFLVISAILICVVSIVTVMVMALQIIRPLKSLTKVTEAVQKGDLSARATVKTKDEIGALAFSFNHMIESLQNSRKQIESYNQNLEAQVAERTQELKNQMEDMQKLHNLTIDRELKMVELKNEIADLKSKLANASSN